MYGSWKEYEKNLEELKFKDRVQAPTPASVFFSLFPQNTSINYSQHCTCHYTGLKMQHVAAVFNRKN